MEKEDTLGQVADMLDSPLLDGVPRFVKVVDRDSKEVYWIALEAKPGAGDAK
jgi:hypothetical protein